LGFDSPPFCRYFFPVFFWGCDPFRVRDPCSVSNPGLALLPRTCWCGYFQLFCSTIWGFFVLGRSGDHFVFPDSYVAGLFEVALRVLLFLPFRRCTPPPPWCSVTAVNPADFSPPNKDPPPPPPHWTPLPTHPNGPLNRGVPPVPVG